MSPLQVPDFSTLMSNFVCEEAVINDRKVFLHNFKINAITG